MSAGLFVPSEHARSWLHYETAQFWTPTLTFATPGDLSISYSLRNGIIRRVGFMVVMNVDITTSSFTHTTASGQAIVTGLPYVSIGTSVSRGSALWQGITKANYTDMNLSIAPSEQQIRLSISGSGQTAASVNAADMPTGGSVRISGTIVYFLNDIGPLGSYPTSGVIGAF